MAEKNDKKLFEFLAEQLVNPQQFVSEAKRLHSFPLAQSLDTVEFKDGRIYEMYSQPQRIDNRVIGRVWSFRDITERKLFERDINETKQTLQLVIDNIPHAVFWKDRNSTYLGCNAAFAKDMHLARTSDILGKTDYSLLYKKEQADYYRHCDANIMDADVPQYHSIEQRQTNGNQVWVDINRIPLHDSSGNVIGVLGSYEDITERKKAEEISDLYNNSPCGYHSLDKDGTFVLMNDTELKWLGYSRQEVIGKMKFSDIITPESLKTFEYTFPIFKEQGWVEDLEFEMVCKDGSILPVLLNAIAVKDAQGNYIQSRSVMFRHNKNILRQENLHSSASNP